MSAFAVIHIIQILSIDPLLMMCMLLLFGSSSLLELETGLPLLLGLDIILLCGIDHLSSSTLVIDKAMDRFLDGVQCYDTKAGIEARYGAKRTIHLSPIIVFIWVGRTSIERDILWFRQIS